MEKFSRKEIFGWAIFFILIIPIFNLEYDTIKAKLFLYPILWISIAYILIKKIKRKSMLRTIVFTVGGFIYFFLALDFLIDLTGFCAWSRSNILYISKSDKSIEIDCRSYECFMTSGDCELYKLKKITNHLKWVTKFEEKNIDTSKWEKVSLEFGN